MAAFVPICGELLWIDLFMLVNSVTGIKKFGYVWGAEDGMDMSGVIFFSPGGFYGFV